MSGGYNARRAPATGAPPARPAATRTTRSTCCRGNLGRQAVALTLYHRAA